METGGIVEVMSMAEGALFRFGKTGDYYEPPCWAMGGCSVHGAPMCFQISVRDDGEDKRAEIDLRQRRSGGSSWKLFLSADGRWDGAVYGGEPLSDEEWEIDGDIWKAVRRRNSALEPDGAR